MSVKTLAGWSAHALSMCPGNLSGLVDVNLFKGLTPDTESMITQSSRKAGAFMHGPVLLASN